MPLTCEFSPIIMSRILHAQVLPSVEGGPRTEERAVLPGQRREDVLQGRVVRPGAVHLRPARDAQSQRRDGPHGNQAAPHARRGHERL